MKIVVVLGERKEIFQGDSLSVHRIGSDEVPIIRIQDEASQAAPRHKILAEFREWDYWVGAGEIGDYTKALREIMNLVMSSNPLAEKLHFIGEALHGIGFLAEKEIPAKTGT